MISVTEWQQGIVTVTSGLTVAGIVAGFRAARSWTKGLGKRLDALEDTVTQRHDRLDHRVTAVDNRLTHLERKVDTLSRNNPERGL